MKSKKDETPGRKAKAHSAASDSGAAGTDRTASEDFRTACAQLGESSASGGGRIADPFGLIAWADRNGRLIRDPFFERLPLISNSTSEHEVWYDEEEKLVYKRTWPGFFGQVPQAGDGVIKRRIATVREYLERQALQNDVFGPTIYLEGVHVSGKPPMIIGEPAGQPSLVISQEFVESVADVPPTPTQIASFMEKHGFREIPKSYFGWYRSVDNIVIVDAKPDNFVLNRTGLTPIDLQMAQFTSEEMRKSGLDAEQPETR
jgi:hypothetical protein